MWFSEYSHLYFFQGLWQADTALGQPGLSLFTLYNYPFNCILPYKKSNSINNENNTSTSQCLISCIIRIILYVLGLNQSSVSYQRILLSLKRIISRVSYFNIFKVINICSLCTSIIQSSRSHIITELFDQSIWN